MDETKPITPARTVDYGVATYWSSLHSEPCGMELLIELGSHGALRVALTLPDLVAAGLGHDVARACVTWAERVWRSRPEHERQLFDISVGLALGCINGELNADGIQSAWWEGSPMHNLEGQLSSNLLVMVNLAIGPKPDRGAFFEAFADFAVVLGKASENVGETFDAILFDVSRFIAYPEHYTPPAFFDGGYDRAEEERRASTDVAV
jgi:hypothetical protein